MKLMMDIKSEIIQSEDFFINVLNTLNPMGHYNYDKNEYSVYKLEDYTEKLASEHSIHQETTETFTLESLKQQYENVLAQQYTY